MVAEPPATEAAQTAEIADPAETAEPAEVQSPGGSHPRPSTADEFQELRVSRERSERPAHRRRTWLVLDASPLVF